MTATEVRRISEPLLPRDGRRRRRLVLVLAVVLVLALVVTWLVAFSSAFGVRTVQVHGVRTLSVGQVERAARIEHGAPLVRLDTAAITKRVEALPDVESAQVSTSFPSTVVVTVRERVAVGYVDVAGRRMLVDRIGEQYRTVATVPAGLPKLVVPVGSDRHTTGGAVATVAQALPSSLRARIRSIEALDPRAITLVLRNGTLVRWGSADRSALKARILSVLGTRKVDQIDLTDPERPFTR
ncbi:MAG: FtsQ-type POTRA domain-containing protein [Jatrophihabitans sp.]